MTDDGRAPSETLTSFLAKCDAEFERARLEALESVSTVREPHLKRLGAVLSVAAGLEAKRQVMRFVPDELDLADIRPHFERLLGQIQSHEKMVTKFTAEAEAGEAERNRGREIARRNAQVGVDRAEHAIRAELERHNAAVGRLATVDAIDAEHTRHERKIAELMLKAEGALSALAAVS